MFKKNKEAEVKQPSFSVNPNSSKIFTKPYAKIEDDDEEISDEEIKQKVEAQLAELEKTKASLQRVISEKEIKEEISELPQEEPKEEASKAFILQGTIKGEGVYEYVIEANYPLFIGPCEIKQ